MGSGSSNVVSGSNSSWNVKKSGVRLWDEARDDGDIGEIWAL